MRIYETDQYPHDAEAHAENVVTWASQGCGFMAFHCHGAPDCFWLIDDCFTNVNAAQLTNGEKLPVLFGFACSTAAFDNELPDWPYTSADESMPEHFLLRPDGGAISYVGATRLALASGFGHAQQRMATGAIEYPYFSAYFDGMKTPAMMMAESQRRYLQNIGVVDFYSYFNLAEYAQFGDPVLSIGLEPGAGSGHHGQAYHGIDRQWEFVHGAGRESFSWSDLVNSGAPAAEASAVLTTQDSEVQILTGTVLPGRHRAVCKGIHGNRI